MRHIFDLDHTLLTCNISYEFGKHLYRQNWIRLPQLLPLITLYACHKYLNLPLATLHQQIFKRLFLGRSFAELQREIDLFLNQNLSTFLYAPALSHLLPDSLILSSSPDFLVLPLAERLKVEGRGSTYLIDPYTGKLSAISQIMDGQTKALSLPLGPCTYYTDSLLDLPVIKRASRVVAVQPDRKLKKLAFQNGWEIL